MGEAVARATDCGQTGRVVAFAMLTLGSITLCLVAVAAAIRAFRAIEHQTLLAILDGKALWAELTANKKKSQTFGSPEVRRAFTPLSPHRARSKKTAFGAANKKIHDIQIYLMTMSYKRDYAPASSNTL